MKRLYLFDTLFHTFRAFYALPRTMESPDGVPNNAIHGVLGIFSNLWKAERIQYAAAVFESLEGVFREELDSEYKANRDPPDPRLKQQIPLVREACDRLGIPTIEVPRYEADDVIGALTKRASEAGFAVTIVSNDKDLAQLLTLGPRVELLRTKGKDIERVASGEVQEFFGVPAELIPSWLALRGDTVDNIPGIKGVGPKTASKLLLEHGHLDNLLANPSLAGPRFGPLIEEQVDRLRLNLKLATIATDIPLGFEGFNIDYFYPGRVDGAAEFFRKMGMRRYQNAMEGQLHPTVHELWS